MGVIKAPHVPTAAAPFSMRDIEHAARAVLLRAREQADTFLAEAQREAEELKANAFAAGVIEGRREGLAQGLAEGRAVGARQALDEQKSLFADAVGALGAAMREIDAGRQ